MSKTTERQEEVQERGINHSAIKQEGGAIHPDDPNHGYWGDDPEEYKRRLKAYIEENGYNGEYCRNRYVLMGVLNKLGLDPSLAGPICQTCKKAPEDCRCLG